MEIANRGNNGFISRSELASRLGIHRDTLRKLLLKNGINLPSGLISPKNLKVIKEKLGISDT